MFLQHSHTTDEQELVQACFLESIDKSNTPLADAVKLVSELRQNLGAIRDVDKNQLIFEAKHLLNNFKFLTLQEIRLAFEMFMSGRLKVGAHSEHHFFSNFLVTRILVEYSEYRTEQMQLITERIKPKEEPHKSTPAERASNMRFFIEEVFKQCHSSCDYVVFADIVYRYLWKKGLLVISAEDRQKAKEYAHTAFSKFTQENTKTISNIINTISNSESKDVQMRNLGYEYHLTRFFEGKELGDVLELVSEDDFKIVA